MSDANDCAVGYNFLSLMILCFIPPMFLVYLSSFRTLLPEAANQCKVSCFFKVFVKEVPKYTCPYTC